MVKTGIISIFESKLIYQMKGHSLKLYLFFLFSLMFSLSIKAQNFHYIYIQTENQKPFYIKIDGQTLVSTLSGYIIIPRLTQRSYRSYIGFPHSSLPELSVNFIINDADAGYLIKIDLDEGLYVVDLQTKKFISTERLWPVLKTTIKSKDEFAKILSEVVNDSSINEIVVFKNSVEPVVKSEQNKSIPGIVTVQSPAIINNATEIVIDNKDTVTLRLQKDTGKAISANQNKKPKLKKGIAAIQNKSTPTKPTALNQKDTVGVVKTNVVSSNPKCKKSATPKEFLDLTKKMNAEKTETARRALALKKFTAVCFTTEQIKSLGALFTKEEEKYKFYVSAYPYVADTENFATLESQLVEGYYIIRFKAMVQH